MYQRTRTFFRPADSWSSRTAEASNLIHVRNIREALGQWTNNVSSWVNGARTLLSSFGRNQNVRPCPVAEKVDEQRQYDQYSGLQIFNGVNLENPFDLISTGALRCLSDDIQLLLEAASAKPSVWRTSYSSWGSFELDSTLSCNPRQLWELTFGPCSPLRRHQSILRQHALLSSFTGASPDMLLRPSHGWTPDSQQYRGFKSHRRRAFLGSIGGEAGGGSDKAPFTRQPPDTTAGKMKLYAENDRYDKLKGLFTNPALSSSEQDKMKIAFAEGYLAAGDPNRAQSRAARWLRAFQQILMITVFLALLLSLMGPGMFRVSVGSGNEVMPEDIHETFDDVKGVDEAKQELQDVVEFLKNPKRFVTLGGKLPKGVLLVGPPGTGKTLLARAVAGEAGVPFFHAAGPEFDEILVGQGARRVRDLFRAAKARAPCVVFIDEIDSVGSKRTNSVLHPYANQTINQLLAEMDGFVQNEGVIVLGATNRREDLDKALLRPGRFDVEVQVPVPDYEGRLEIIKLYLTKVKGGPDVNEEKLSRGTTGFTGADIENLVNQAALKAAMDGSDYVQQKHLEFARDKILMGPERKSRIPDEETNRLTAFHEGGHALVAYYTKEAQTLHKVTIIPRGPSLGHTSYIPEKERYHITKAQMLAMLDTFMGGRVAEELVFGADHVTSGASSDLKQATSLAEHMVREFGMSEKVGLRYYTRPEGGLVVVNDNSPQTAEAIDGEVNRILRESYARAMQILKDHRNELNLLADALLKYETLDVEDIKAIVEGRETLPVSARHEQHRVPSKPPAGTPFPMPGNPGSGKRTPLPSGI